MPTAGVMKLDHKPFRSVNGIIRLGIENLEIVAHQGSMRSIPKPEMKGRNVAKRLHNNILGCRIIRCGSILKKIN